MGVKHIYTDEYGIKRCEHLDKPYPSGCSECKHSVPIFCGCDYEDYNGEGLGEEGE
jgi:hypothetical protein